MSAISREQLAATLEVALSEDSEPALRRDAALALARTLIGLHAPSALPAVRRLLDEATANDGSAHDEAPAAQPDPGADVPLCFYDDGEHRHLLL